MFTSPGSSSDRVGEGGGQKPKKVTQLLIDTHPLFPPLSCSYDCVRRDSCFLVTWRLDFSAFDKRRD